MKRGYRIALGVLMSLLIVPFAPAQAGVILSPTNERVTDSGQLDAWVGEPRITRQGNTLYAVWRDARRTDSLVEADIFFARSDNGGQTWSQNRRVSNTRFVGFTNHPDISVSPDGTIWVTWGLDACYDTSIDCGGNGSLFNDVRGAWSTDGGQTWTEGGFWNGTPGSISDDLNQRPQVHADNDRIFTLLHDPTFSSGDVVGFDIVLHVITRTTTLNAGFVLLTPSSSSGRPNTFGGPLTALAVNGNTVCAAWEDLRNTSSIYGSCSTNRGVSFPAAARWSTNGNDSDPKLAFGPDGTLYLSYKDQENKDILVRSSTNNGGSWSTPRSATNIGAAYTFSYDLTVAPDGQLVLPVAVSAFSLPDDTNLNVYTSIDRGQTFSGIGPVETGPERFLDISTQMSIGVTTSGSATNARAHIIWMDDRGEPTQTKNFVWSATLTLDGVAPSAPGNLRATGGDTSILLEWDPATDANGVAYYRVERAAVSGGPYTQISSRPVTQTFYRDVGLPAGRYYYRVIAVDSTANSGAPSNEAGADATVGGAVSGVNGTLAYGRISGGGVGVRPLTAGAAGAEAVIPGGSFPNYSTDGQRLYYFNSANNTILAGDRNGNNPQLAYSASLGVNEFDLPANPGFIAGIFQDNFNGACLPFEARLVQVTPSVTISGTSDTNADSIAVSPDRRWVGYTNRLYCNLAGTTLYDTNRLCLIDTTAATFSERCQVPANVQGVDFGNTGNIIVFSANYSGQNEIWRASVTSSGDLINFVQLTRGPAGQPSFNPRVSSDGNWVVFVRDIDAGAGENLQAHIVRADGDSLRSLAFAASTIAWSGGGPAGPVVGLSQRVYLPATSR